MGIDLKSHKKGATKAIVFFTTFLLSIPVFILVYRFVPEISIPIGSGFRIDHLLTIIVVIIVIRFLVRRFLIAFLGALIALFLFLTVSEFTGGYSFSDAFYDYAALVHSIKTAPIKVTYAAKDTGPYKYEDQILDAIDYNNPDVIDFAREAGSKNFKEYISGSDNRTLIQCFSLFKEINSRWEYFSDPRSGEYFADASRSLLSFKGDCDDHSILMAACIEAIGGQARLVVIKIERDGLVSGHIYPEIFIGDKKDLEDAIYLIRQHLFPNEAKGRSIFYHEDTNGNIWLNLDYTGSYPGGKFLSDEIVKVIEVPTPANRQ